MSIRRVFEIILAYFRLFMRLVYHFPIPILNSESRVENRLKGARKSVEPHFVDALSKLVFSGQDAYGSVEVVDRAGTRSLHFGTQGPQSEMSLEKPDELLVEYSRAMLVALQYQPNPSSLLILGLGGGSLPKFLWKALPYCQIDAVERSPVVAEVAYRFFQLPKCPRLQVTIGDALEFLRVSENRYDLLFIDLFDSEGIPKWLEESQLFYLCQKRLRDRKSVMAWNFFPGSSDMGKLFAQAAAPFGGNVRLFPTGNGKNFILLGFPTMGAGRPS